MSNERLAFFEEMVRDNIATDHFPDYPISLGNIIGAEKPIEVIDIQGNLYVTDTSVCITSVRPASTCLFIEKGKVDDYVESEAGEDISIQYGLIGKNNQMHPQTHHLDLGGYDLGLPVVSVFIGESIPKVNGDCLYPTEFDDTLIQEL